MNFEFTCKNCGRPVKTRRTPAQLKIAGEPQFCSQKCNGEDKTKNKVGATSNVFYHCLSCGKEVATYRSPSARKSFISKFCSLKCIGIAQSGDGNPAWNGGRYEDQNGYINIFMPDHPYVNIRGYIYEHRFVMEQMIGRFLKPEEVVHHDDTNTINNDPENLILFKNQSEHRKYHIKLKRLKNEHKR
jgi:hypothetical protein